MVRTTNKQTTTTTTAGSSAVWWIVRNKADYLPYKGNIVLAPLKECCAGTTVEKQLHLTGTSSIRLELSATQPAWRGKGSSPIKRAVREGADPVGHYKRIQPPDQTKTKKRTEPTDRETKDKRAQLNLRQTKL